MKRKRLLTTAAGTLVAAVIAGVAWASIPGPGNVYNACMLKGLGTIRLIDKSLPASNLMSRCTDRETEISWNQAGQPGPPGPQGVKGEPGAPGINGTNGTNGADGKDGVSATTASEPAGANCAEGGVQLTAVNGISYLCNGERGPEGKQGPTGLQGLAGPTAPAGPAGSGGPTAWATVAADGALVAGSPGVQVSWLFNGIYRVGVPFDPHQCATLVTTDDASQFVAVADKQFAGNFYRVNTFRDWSIFGIGGSANVGFSTAVFCG
jgi:hypothetical protein